MADDAAGLDFFVEELGLLFEQLGHRRMDGRVLGYLMLSTDPYVSTAELMSELGASAGSISSATRALSEPGFIRRVPVPGSRSHYYRADEDVWGAFLSSEHRFFALRRRLANSVLAALEPENELVRKRMENMHDYFEWLETYHQKMYGDWEAYKAARDRDRDA